MEVAKRRTFVRWQMSEHLPDSALCDAAKEMDHGLVGSNLGSLLYKKRIARRGKGKSGGYRTLVAVRIGYRFIFLLGYAKNDKENLTAEELRALRFAGQLFLELSPTDYQLALESGVLLEVRCEQDH
jgi:hypothetical protein